MHENYKNETIVNEILIYLKFYTPHLTSIQALFNLIKVSLLNDYLDIFALYVSVFIYALID